MNVMNAILHLNELSLAVTIDTVTVCMCALQIQLLGYPGQPFACSLLQYLHSSVYN